MKSYKQFISEKVEPREEPLKRYSVYCSYVNGTEHHNSYDRYAEAALVSQKVSRDNRCKTFITDNYQRHAMPAMFQYGKEYKSINEEEN